MMIKIVSLPLLSLHCFLSPHEKFRGRQNWPLFLPGNDFLEEGDHFRMKTVCKSASRNECYVFENVNARISTKGGGGNCPELWLQWKQREVSPYPTLLRKV